MAETVECVCGAEVHLTRDDVWVDGRGQDRCYPDADNPNDREARHEPDEYAPPIEA